MDSNSGIGELRRLYTEGKLIPFIGTGLSYPFSVPDWASLIRKISGKHLRPSMVDIINQHLDKYEYWEAVDVLKKYVPLSDFQLQEEICNELKACINVKIDDELHNYTDITRMNFKIYFTTNYDLLLSKYISDSRCVPQVLNKTEINSQKIFEIRDYPQLWHLHGHIEDCGSIVISREVYEKLYTDEKYRSLFTVVQGVGTFLFMGFSFNDIYIKDLLSLNNKSLNTTNYIMLESPTDEIKRDFANKYNIKVIGYKTEKGSHSIAIKKILNQIAAPVGSDATSLGIVTPRNFDDLIIPDRTPTAKEKTALEVSLFCKKLRIESINNELTEFSKDCFFFSDKLLRALNKHKFLKKDIQKIFAEVYMSYSKGRKNIYANTKNSQLLLEHVMDELQTKDFKKIHQALDLNDFQKQGFIHNLADNEKHAVWWGENKDVK